MKTLLEYKPEKVEKSGVLRGINTKSEVVERYVYKLNEMLCESYKKAFLQELQ